MHNKENYKQGEKTALRLGENNSKLSNRKGLISKILTLLRKKKSQDFFPQKRKISNQCMYEKPGYLL